MRKKIALLLGPALIVLVAGCSTDPTTTDEYLDLEQRWASTQEELLGARADLANAIEERDELMAELEVPDAVVDLLDDWWQANERSDGSVSDLYVANGYHQYGSQRISKDQLGEHFGSSEYEAEWITEPYLIAAEPEGRYVVSRGVRNSTGVMSFASALTFELEENSDGTLQILHSDWSYVTP